MRRHSYRGKFGCLRLHRFFQQRNHETAIGRQLGPVDRLVDAQQLRVPQGLCLLLQAENGFDRGAVHPGGSTGVPAPATATDAGRLGVNIDLPVRMVMGGSSGAFSPAKGMLRRWKTLSLSGAKFLFLLT
jgi:hypothetical protein